MQLRPGIEVPIARFRNFAVFVEVAELDVVVVADDPHIELGDGGHVVAELRKPVAV